jgi:hypothetical protein
MRNRGRQGSVFEWECGTLSMPSEGLLRLRVLAYKYILILTFWDTGRRVADGD